MFKIWTGMYIIYRVPFTLNLHYGAPDHEIDTRETSERNILPFIRRRWELRRGICGTTRQQSGSWYAKLFYHVSSKHSYRCKKLQEVKGSLNLSSTSNDSLILENKALFLYSKKCASAHCWLDLTVYGLSPFSIVEERVFRAHVKHLPIDRKSVSKYMNLLTRRVKDKIRRAFPEKFEPAFYGWSEGETQ